MAATIWITGANGFTACHLLTHLREVEPEARLVGLARGGISSRGYDALHDVDFAQADSLASIAKSDPPTQVYHTAGAVYPATDDELYKVNVDGTRDLLNAVAKQDGGCRVLITSSAAVYQPSATFVSENSPAGGASDYGKSKWEQEQIALTLGSELGINVVVARTFNLVGPGLPERLLAGAVCAKMKANQDKPIKLGDLSAYRDFIDVRDAVAAYHTIMHKGETGGVYNVCTGNAVLSRDMVHELASIAGCSELIQEAQAEDRPGVDFSEGDPSRLKALGWQPHVTLNASLCDMLGAMRANH